MDHSHATRHVARACSTQRDLKEISTVDRLRVGRLNGRVPREQKMLKGHLPRVNTPPSILVYEENHLLFPGSRLTLALIEISGIPSRPYGANGGVPKWSGRERPFFFFFITLGLELSDTKSTSLKYEHSGKDPPSVTQLLEAVAFSGFKRLVVVEPCTVNCKPQTPGAARVGRMPPVCKGHPLVLQRCLAHKKQPRPIGPP